jgi:hypothetical protein
MRRIGVLMINPENDPEGQTWVRVFREEIQKLGWTEGRNIRKIAAVCAITATPRDRNAGLQARAANCNVAAQTRIVSAGEFEAGLRKISKVFKYMARVAMQWRLCRLSRIGAMQRAAVATNADQAKLEEVTAQFEAYKASADAKINWHWAYAGIAGLIAGFTAFPFIRRKKVVP